MKSLHILSLLTLTMMSFGANFAHAEIDTDCTGYAKDGLQIDVLQSGMDPQNVQLMWGPEGTRSPRVLKMNRTDVVGYWNGPEGFLLSVDGGDSQPSVRIVQFAENDSRNIMEVTLPSGAKYEFKKFECEGE